EWTWTTRKLSRLATPRLGLLDLVITVSPAKMSSPSRPVVEWSSVLRWPASMRWAWMSALRAAAWSLVPTVTAILRPAAISDRTRSEEHTSELQSRFDLVCRLLLEKKNDKHYAHTSD